MNAAKNVEQIGGMKAQVEEVARKEVLEASGKGFIARGSVVDDVLEGTHEQFEHLVTLVENGEQNLVRYVVLLGEGKK